VLHHAEGVEDGAVVATVVGDQGRNVRAWSALETSDEAEAGGGGEDGPSVVHPVRLLVAPSRHR
jgi:hypothetical protein